MNKLHQAVGVKNGIKPILDTITAARNQQGGLNLDGYKCLLRVTEESLLALVKQADRVIAASETAHLQRPIDLINKAALRQGLIPGEIDKTKALLSILIKTHDDKVVELKHRGFTAKEIESISPYPHAEVDDHAAKIEELKAELVAIEKFLMDGPRYDIALLDGVNLDCLLQTTTVPDDRPPLSLWTEGMFSDHPNVVQSRQPTGRAKTAGKRGFFG